MFTLLLLSPMATKAQSGNTYRWEVGAGVGMVAYEGDFNNSPLKGMKPMASAMLRRVLNPYMALRLDAAYGKLCGQSGGAKSYYEQYDGTPYSFDTKLVSADITYGTGHDYREAKRLTPFVFGGLGLTYAKPGMSASVVTANVPLGIGVKYKLAERLNLGLEWAMHFSLSDKLDGVADPYGISSSGLFKNTDCYSALQLSLTYSFSAKCPTCHNADED